MNFLSELEQKKVENSYIRPDSESLTSNTREPVDLSFNRSSFIHGPRLGAPVRGVGMKLPMKTGV